MRAFWSFFYGDDADHHPADFRDVRSESSPPLRENGRRAGKDESFQFQSGVLFLNCKRVEAICHDFADVLEVLICRRPDDYVHAFCTRKKAPPGDRRRANAIRKTTEGRNLIEVSAETRLRGETLSICVHLTCELLPDRQ